MSALLEVQFDSKVIQVWATVWVRVALHLLAVDKIRTAPSYHNSWPRTTPKAWAAGAKLSCSNSLTLLKIVSENERTSAWQQQDA